jgi:hypothetical protein
MKSAFRPRLPLFALGAASFTRTAEPLLVRIAVLAPAERG